MTSQSITQPVPGSLFEDYNRAYESEHASQSSSPLTHSSASSSSAATRHQKSKSTSHSKSFNLKKLKVTTKETPRSVSPTSSSSGTHVGSTTPGGFGKEGGVSGGGAGVVPASGVGVEGGGVGGGKDGALLLRKTSARNRSKTQFLDKELRTSFISRVGSTLTRTDSKISTERSKDSKMDRDVGPLVGKEREPHKWARTQTATSFGKPKVSQKISS